MGELTPLTLAEWIAVAEALLPANDLRQITPDVDGEERQAERRGDYLSDRDQDQLSAERAG